MEGKGCSKCPGCPNSFKQIIKMEDEEIAETYYDGDKCMNLDRGWVARVDDMPEDWDRVRYKFKGRMLKMGGHNATASKQGRQHSLDSPRT